MVPFFKADAKAAPSKLSNVSANLRKAFNSSRLILLLSLFANP